MSQQEIAWIDRTPDIPEGPPILEEARKRNSYPLGLVMLPQIVGSMEVSSGSSASDSPSA